MTGLRKGHAREARGQRVQEKVLGGGGVKIPWFSEMVGVAREGGASKS
jgi:hypothetical protein